MGPPAGRQTRWGKAGAPQRGGLTGVKRRFSPSQAEERPPQRVLAHLSRKEQYILYRKKEG